MPTKNTNVIELPELKKQAVQIRLIGDSPLIVHRFGEKARKLGKTTTQLLGASAA